MKFAHFSDVHIGGWKEEKLNIMSTESFRRGIDKCIEENVAFVLIAGDLFNTALPNIDLIKEVSSILKKLKDREIECYIIPGSHDFSPSGKTMIDVFENSGLVTNVMKTERSEDSLKLNFTTDKTGAKLTGLYGKAKGLERLDYDILDKTNLEAEESFKIFLFHHIINEYKPQGMEMVEGIDLDKFPKGFDYYAGGHPHVVFDSNPEGFGLVTYPGATFPNNFMELEKFGGGGFYIVEVQNNKITKLRYEFIEPKKIEKVKLNVDGKTSSEAEEFIIQEVSKLDSKDKIITLRVKGSLSSGKVSDINFNEIFDKLEDAYIVLKNTNKLQTKEIQELEIESTDIDKVEENLIEEFSKQGSKLEFTKESLSDLKEVLAEEKLEGEKNADFERRLEKNLIKSLNLEEIWD